MHTVEFLRDVWSEVVDAVYPPICFLCGAAAESCANDRERGEVEATDRRRWSAGDVRPRAPRRDGPEPETCDGDAFERESSVFGESESDEGEPCDGDFGEREFDARASETNTPDQRGRYESGLERGGTCGNGLGGSGLGGSGLGEREVTHSEHDAPEIHTRSARDRGGDVGGRRHDRTGTNFAPRDLACRAHRLPLRPAGTRCPKCAARLPHALEHSKACAACARRSPGLDATVVLADYRAQPAIRDWILAFKHGGRRDLAGPLGAALARCAGEKLARADRRELLVPVPLHVWRRIERGYDQAGLLANSIGAARKLPVVRALRRVRATAVQGGIGAVSRAANVRGAFRSAIPAWRFRAVFARADYVWLVDDVFTSGSTLRECARILRRLGAPRVGALALARAAAKPDDEERPLE